MPGPNKTIPKNPIATEGMAASISITGFKIICIFVGATSERNAAVRMPKGTAIIIDPTATKNVLTIKGKMLYLVSGSH